jgi:dihydroorotate dehydrogenase (NAD+) catalytic subunit
MITDKKIDLSVRIGGLKFANPVMVASGTWGPEYGELADVKGLGAIVAKTITIKPRSGNPPPRVVETPSGMLNAIGLENKGLEDFLSVKLPALRKFGAPVIASVSGDSEEDFAKLAACLGKVKSVAAIELNLSCPNIKHGKRDRLIAQDAPDTLSVVRAARRATDLTIIAKLSPNVTDITAIAKAAEKGGADAVSLVNTFIGMAVDVDSQSAILGNVTGGLSGPAIKPLALRMVWEVHKKIGIPIIGIGGIMDWRDAVEFILCGASAVQVGTAGFVDPGAPVKILDGIRRYLKNNGIRIIGEITGALRTD